MDVLLTIGTAAVPAFLASVVEFVEALTIVLAVGITRGWRYTLFGTAGAVVTLAAIVAVLGAALTTIIPIHLFLIVVGTLLLLFGLRWLRKAVLRFAGIVALHDEELIYQREVAALRAQGLTKTGHDWFAFAVAYKAVLLEGTEVAFIVITMGFHGAQEMTSAVVGAAAAGILVIGSGILLKKPLSQVPENWLKFGVGALLSTFGVYWGAEGFGVEWALGSATLFPIFAVFLAVCWLAVKMLNSMLPEGAQVASRNV